MAPHVSCVFVCVCVQWIGNFAARCVADDCLAPKFLQESSHEPDSLTDKARESLSHATALLKMPHGMVRLDNVWGTGGGELLGDKKIVRSISINVCSLVFFLKRKQISNDVGSSF